MLYKADKAAELTEEGLKYCLLVAKKKREKRKGNSILLVSRRSREESERERALGFH